MAQPLRVGLHPLLKCHQIGRRLNRRGMEAKEDISAAESGSSEAALRQTTPVGSEALHKTTERVWRPVPDDRSKSFRDRIQNRRWQIVGAIAVVAIVAVAGWYLWNYLHSYEWTD